MTVWWYFFWQCMIIANVEDKGLWQITNFPIPGFNDCDRDFVVFQDQSSSAGALWQLDSLLRQTFLINCCCCCCCCCCCWYCFCCCGWLYLWHSESCRLVQTPFTLSSETFFNSFWETQTILIQVCVRLYHAKKRMQDPELDNLINPHEVTVKRSYHFLKYQI